MSANSIEIYRHTPTMPWTYADLERRQEKIRDDVLAGGRGKLLFSEVAPVITQGLRRNPEDFTAGMEDFAKRGIVLHTTARGGRATYHGPGQWVVFPVESLESLVGDRKGVRKIVTLLWDAALEVCRIRFPQAEIREGCEAGVWSCGGSKGGKVVSLGLRFDRGVLQHGFAVNIFRTPESFFGIRPCGLDASAAFLEDEKDAATREEIFVLWRSRLEAALIKRFKD